MRPIIVRDSTEADLKAVRRIYSYYVLTGLGSFEEAPPSLAELKRRRRQVLDLGLPYLVAVVDGAVIGFSYATLFRERSAYRYTIEDSIYVDPQKTRNGAGRALLSTLIEHCSGGGWRQMIAVIGDRNNVASIALHQSLGFRMTGTLCSVGLKLGRWVDAVLMQRELGTGDRTLLS